MKKIAIGQVWETRGGELAMVHSRDETSYPWNLKPRSCVTDKGREYDDGTAGDLDLIRLVKTQATALQS